MDTHYGFASTAGGGYFYKTMALFTASAAAAAPAAKGRSLILADLNTLAAAAGDCYFLHLIHSNIIFHE